MTGRAFMANAGGVEIEVLEYGARLSRCLVPDIDGVLADVVPGFESEEEYSSKGGTMGAIVGRYANRISDGSVSIEGRTFELSKNDGRHTMHGGEVNFSKRRWSGEQISASAIRMKLFSEDGDQGWPGSLDVTVDYALAENGSLSIQMRAVPDADTYINMLFHGYWNMGGHEKGNVGDHILSINAGHYLPKSELGVPTGEKRDVVSTPFDFLAPKPIGQDIALVGRGYGHNLCLNNSCRDMSTDAATLFDPVSGRGFTLRTNQPGLQLFTANLWNDLDGKRGARYQAHDAVALESQKFPNTPKTPQFCPAVDKAKQEYHHSMIFRFLARHPGAFA